MAHTVSDGGPLRVLGIAGSLRRDSFNRALLRAATELLPEGMTLELYEKIGELPHYNADVEAQGDPEPVLAFKSSIEQADALLFATPEYNYGIPGVLKNAIDWASRPAATSVLKKKPAAIMGASVGAAGTARAQLSLRQTFVFTQTLAVLQPEVLVANAAQRFDSSGRLTHEPSRHFIRLLLEALMQWTLMIRQSRAPQELLTQPPAVTRVGAPPARH